jgi:hypothetical protein
MGYQAAEQGLDEVVRRARQLGCTWEQIGLRLGLTQQGAQQRFGPRMGDNLTVPTTSRLSKPTLTLSPV